MSNQKRIFTREDIRKMSNKEFAKNEKEIMEQLKTTGIPSYSEFSLGQETLNLQEYTKKNKHIFTREEIGAMSQKEFDKNENAINYQMRIIGIPSKQELINKTQSSNPAMENKFNNNYPYKDDSHLTLDEKNQEIVKFLKKHAENVGTIQAIKDFQKGMNLLNKGKKISPLKEKHPLKEDGHLGKKTFACLCSLNKNYPLNLIKKYIRRGAINNLIFKTKNDNRIDTEKEVNKIYSNLRFEKEL